MQYSFALKTMAMGIMYGPLYPPAYLFTALGLAFSYLATRVALRYYYARPESVGQVQYTLRPTGLSHPFALSHSHAP